MTRAATLPQVRQQRRHRQLIRNRAGRVETFRTTDQGGGLQGQLLNTSCRLKTRRH